MKKVFIFLGIVLFVGTVYAKGSVDVSTESVTIEEGKIEEIIVTADNAAGLVEIESTDSNIVIADQNKYFFDSGLKDDKLIIKLTGKKAGSAQINVKLADVSTYDEETLDGTKVVNVTVNGDNNVNNDTDTDTPSNTIYYVIGGVAVILLLVVLFGFKNKKKEF